MILKIKWYYTVILATNVRSIDGLVGYDAALTRLRSRVRFPLDVLLLFHSWSNNLWENCCLIAGPILEIYRFHSCSIPALEDHACVKCELNQTLFLRIRGDSGEHRYIMTNHDIWVKGDDGIRNHRDTDSPHHFSFYYPKTMMAPVILSAGMKDGADGEGDCLGACRICHLQGLSTWC